MSGAIATLFLIVEAPTAQFYKVRALENTIF
jgi:hypothetical protein